MQWWSMYNIPNWNFGMLLNGGAVGWCSSKQSVVAGSTCEADYIVASEAANEGVWMKEFISDTSPTYL